MYSHMNRGKKSSCKKYQSIGTSFTECVVKKVLEITNCKVGIGQKSFKGKWIKTTNFQLRWYQMFTVADNYEECNELLEIDVHLQFWDNLTGSIKKLINKMDLL